MLLTGGFLCRRAVDLLLDQRKLSRWQKIDEKWSNDMGDGLVSAAMGLETSWLGTPEAAERLGITQRTLYRLIDEGQIPAYKMGRVFRVKESDIEVFLEHSRVTPGSLRHLYPDAKTATSESEDSPT
jgi:excisionase family DNA binding protein